MHFLQGYQPLYDMNWAGHVCMGVHYFSFVFPRGFGFVTFCNPNSMEKVLSVKIHQLDAKVVSDKF